MSYKVENPKNKIVTFRATELDKNDLKKFALKEGYKDVSKFIMNECVYKRRNNESD